MSVFHTSGANNPELLLANLPSSNSCLFKPKKGYDKFTTKASLKLKPFFEEEKMIIKADNSIMENIFSEIKNAKGDVTKLLKQGMTKNDKNIENYLKGENDNINDHIKKDLELIKTKAKRNFSSVIPTSSVGMKRLKNYTINDYFK